MGSANIWQPQVECIQSTPPDTTIAPVVQEIITITGTQTLVVFAVNPVATSVFYLYSDTSDATKLHLGISYIIREDLGDYTIELLSAYPTGSQIISYSSEYISATSLIVNKASILPEYIAHRGYQTSFPQNTMLAYSCAARRGATAMECDVQITNDGVAVLFHDDVVDSLTDGSGAIATKTLAQVQSLVFDSVAATQFVSCRIPTFSSLLDYCKATGLELYPEIKKYRTISDISIMIADTVTASMENQVVFSSFSMTDVEYFRTLNSSITCGLLGSSSNPVVYEPVIDALSDLGKGIIIWSYAAILTSPAIVSYAKSKSVQVAAWTVDDNAAAKKLMKLGVTKLVTNVYLEVK